MNIDTKRLAKDRAYWDSLAPEGATHYQPQQQMFYKRTEEDDWRVWGRLFDNNHYYWRLSPGTSDDDLWVKRPEEWIDQWPPVGTECEVDDVDHGWISATVIGHDDTEGVAVCKTLYGYDGYGKFRPLRTQAQRERDEVVDFAARAYLSDRLESDPNLSGEQARKVVAFFYDAGMLRRAEE